MKRNRNIVFKHSNIQKKIPVCFEIFCRFIVLFGHILIPARLVTHIPHYSNNVEVVNTHCSIDTGSNH